MNKPTIVAALCCILFSISCSAVVNPAKEAQAQNAAQASTDSAASAASGQTNNPVDDKTPAGDVSGSYEYKGFGRVNEFLVRQTAADEIKVAWSGVYEFKTKAGLNANTGELAPQSVKLEGNKAVLTPDDAPDCHLTLTFEGKTLDVKQNENDCRMPGGIYIGGAYRKTSSVKPDFEATEPVSPENSSTGDRPGDAKNTAGTDQPRRVRFSKGASSTVIEGSAGNKAPTRYIIGARAGQTLTVEVLDGGGDRPVTIEAVDLNGRLLQLGEDRDGEFLSARLAATGDFLIEVRAEEAGTNFKIRVAIR